MDKQTLHTVNESLKGHCNRLPVNITEEPYWDTHVTEALFNLAVKVRRSYSIPASCSSGLWGTVQRVIGLVMSRAIRNDEE